MLYSRHAILEIDLPALKSNVAYAKRKMNPTTKLIAMVKANAYGLGAVEISKALNDQADYLAVAFAKEAADLRNAEIQKPIMVLNTDQIACEQIIDLQAEPSIFNFRILNLFTEKLIDKEIQQAYPIHLKLNTGMNRLGFGEADLHELIAQLADNPYVKVASIFSHFAVSDEPDGKAFTAEQYERFNTYYERIAFNLGYRPLRHIANSAAIFRFPEFQLDMERLGIGMYGIAAQEQDRDNLEIAVRLKSYISQIRTIKEGETISYGRRFKAPQDMKIAVISLGYADGVHRSLSQRGFVCIHGQKAPITGTICMDMFMVDVSQIDCQEGDEVVIFGENPSIYEVAEAAGTIPYEIITSVAPRVERVYLG
ncbi:alanine racemase [Ornithobacterium rhinotracheale]|uniref:Alanine racemase n=1 Tax=Ornithobacterium rhinotracheale TaxID=28251 RepID=A0A410JPI8_ORNRH|nr:alanine racemase [Ornithobacterium rhinotracheale]QAR30054.1 alanine racemase [Ornithobacterium rhinotracheale]